MQHLGPQKVHESTAPNHPNELNCVFVWNLYELKKLLCADGKKLLFLQNEFLQDFSRVDFVASSESAKNQNILTVCYQP